MRPKIIFITGPTGSGKSDLAIWLAKKVQGEIINADSRQVYRYLDIGSGKIPHNLSNGTRIISNKSRMTNSRRIRKIREGLEGRHLRWIQEGIRHHLLSVASPKKNFSLARWLKLADKSIRGIYQKNKIPIFCGGTNLYLRAIQGGWILPEVKPDYQLRKKLEKLSVEKLLVILRKIAPERLKTIELKNKRRLIRAIEIAKAIGQVPQLKKKPKYNVFVIAIKLPWQKLELKIKKRFKQRVLGIIKEIKKLRQLGLSLKRIMSFGLSYYWLGKYVKGEILLIEAKEKAMRAEINFAKRQSRELKKIKNINWVSNNKEALKISKIFLAP